MRAQAPCVACQPFLASRSIMFFTLILVVWTALHFYVFQRAHTVPWIRERVSRRGFFIVAFVLWTLYFAARFFDQIELGAVAVPLEAIGSSWLGILFVLSVCLFLADLVTGFGYLLRKHVPTLRAIGLGVGALLAAFALVQGLRAPVVSEHEVTVRDLPSDADGVVVTVVSDLHLGTLLGEVWLADRVAQIHEMDPDVVIIAGDLSEGHGLRDSEEVLATVLRRLDPPLGVWAVLGNHESHEGGDDALRFFESAGIRVLQDSWREIRPGLLLAGIGDRGHGADPSDATPLDRALAARPPGTATILVTHRPILVGEAAAAKVGLVLAGHTHGGQIWPFDYFLALVNPLLEGRYEIDGTTAIVCRVTGTWGPRMRLFAPSEIVRITLRAP